MFIAGTSLAVTASTPCFRGQPGLRDILASTPDVASVLRYRGSPGITRQQTSAVALIVPDGPWCSSRENAAVLKRARQLCVPLSSTPELREDDPVP